MAISPDWLLQAAAIPVKDGRICLVTSRNGKGWVIPKGMIDPGKTAGKITRQECREEAGLVGDVECGPGGSYTYEKWGHTCHVTVFVMRVTEQTEEWPESDMRRRVWMTPRQAFNHINDAGLLAVLRETLGTAKS